jgi:hypothetical protein
LLWSWPFINPDFAIEKENSGAKGTCVGGRRAPPVDHAILLLACTHRHFWIHTFFIAYCLFFGRKYRLTFTTIAPTVRPAEEEGYNRVLPGRTESGAFSRKILFCFLVF